MRRWRRASPRIIALLAAGLAVGVLGGCGSAAEPAPTAAPTVVPLETTTVHPVPPLPLPAPQPPGGPIPPEPGLGPEDRARLAEARRIGASWVIVRVASAPGQDTEAANDLKLLGGVVGTTSPGPGYLRVTLPTENVERATALPTITALDVEQVVPPDRPRPSR